MSEYTQTEQEEDYQRALDSIREHTLVQISEPTKANMEDIFKLLTSFVAHDRAKGYWLERRIRDLESKRG